MIVLFDIIFCFIVCLGVIYCLQYKVVDKLKMIRFFVKVENVVFGQQSKNFFNVSDNLRYYWQIVKMKSYYWSVFCSGGFRGGGGGREFYVNEFK